MADDQEITNESDFESMFTDALADSGSSEETVQPEPETPEVTEPEVQPEAQAEPEIEPEVQPEPVEEPPAISEELLTQAQELGLDTSDFSSEQDLYNAALEQIRAMQPAVSYAQQQYAAAQAAANPPREPDPEPEETGWNEQEHWQKQYGGPAWKQEFSQARDAGLVERDVDTGLWKPAPGAEMMVASLLPEMNAAQTHSATFWKKMSEDNPLQVIGESVKPMVEHLVEQRVQEILETRQVEQAGQSAIEQFESQHEAILYQNDPNTGRRVFSEEGRRLVDTVNKLRQDGISDTTAALDYAVKMTGFGQTAPPNPPTEAPTNTEEAAPAAPEVSQEAQQKTFLENARRQSNYAPTATGRDGEPISQVTTEGDLDSMFEVAARTAFRK